MKTEVKVSKKELKALERVASIECTGISCEDCPLLGDVVGNQVCVVTVAQTVVLELGGTYYDNTI